VKPIIVIDYVHLSRNLVIKVYEPRIYIGKPISFLVIIDGISSIFELSEDDSWNEIAKKEIPQEIVLLIRRQIELKYL
jgi:hypothetical protein